jgi:hypothetical protein
VGRDAGVVDTRAPKKPHPREERPQTVHLFAGRIPTQIRDQERRGWVFWFVVMEIFSMLLEWVSLGRKSAAEKDLEILLLRRQLAIVERTLDKPVRPSRRE